MSRGGRKYYVHEKHYPIGKPPVKKTGPPTISPEEMQRALDSVGRFPKKPEQNKPA